MLRHVTFAGLRFQDPSLEAAWHTTGVVTQSAATSITEADIKASKSSWPIVMFLAVVFGGPYLIWRLLSSLAPPVKTKSHNWLKGQGEHYAAIAEYPFQVRAVPSDIMSLNYSILVSLYWPHSL